MKILFNKKDNALIQMAEPHQAQLGRWNFIDLWVYVAGDREGFKRNQSRLNSLNNNQ